MRKLIARNTLLSPAGLNKILLMPQKDGVPGALREVLVKFQDIKKFASEIHTEIHLIKPILKLLGYSYESKPKFFEEQIKGPDVALFPSEEAQSGNSRFWGTEEYYAHTLAILLLKRYGRNLEEGISGFYLEFENRIPLYQTAYLLKKARTPWGILTNGKHWILMKKPVAYETRLISIDLEEGLYDESDGLLGLFCRLFSLHGLTVTLPGLLEEERIALIEILKEKRKSVHDAIRGLRKKTEIFPRAIEAFSGIFSDKELPSTEGYLKENGIAVEKYRRGGVDSIGEYAISDISSYLFNTKGYQTDFDVEEIFLGDGPMSYTKEQLLSVKLLDMTPGFGNTAAALADGIAYLSFTLPYRERNTFVAEWEQETTLKQYIVERLLFGIEKSHVAFDILHNMMINRFKAEAGNYKLGNPLMGMALDDLPGYFDARNQMGLFSKTPEEIIRNFREIYSRHFMLSEKIKEDMQLKGELEVHLKRHTTRLRDAMDIVTTTYFSKSIDSKRIYDVLSSLDSDESTWSRLKAQDWFIAAKGIAKRNGFFHLELEFPFLLNNAFDFIFVQPALRYIWEDAFPLLEITKAYIKRGMPYLKQNGRMVIIMEERLEDELLRELSLSKRYETEIRKGFILLTKKKPGQ